MNVLLAAALIVVGSASGIGDVRVELDAVPGQMNLQGYLTDNAGDPVDEAVQLAAKIYRGGSVQWQESSACTVRSGLFHTVLGSQTSIPASVFEPGTPCELEVAVEGQTLEPRVALTSSGFAFRSVRSDQAAEVDRPLSPQVETNELADGAVTMPKLSPAGAQSGYVIKWTGSYWAPRPDSAGGPPVGNAGGDLDGSYPDPEVVGLRGRDIEDTYPAAGDLLTYRSSRWELELPAGDVDGEIWDLTVTGLQGRPVYSTTPYTGEVLAWTGSRWEPRETGGDLGGYIYDADVTGLQGREVSTNSPSTGDVLTWYSGRWTPRPPAAAGQNERPQPEPAEEFGSLRLVAGTGRVASDAAGQGTMYVFLQQTSGEPVQTVVTKDRTGFTVTANRLVDASFDYRVVLRGE